MLKVNMKEINKYLNEFEMVNNNLQRYLLDSESRIIEKIKLIHELMNKLENK